MRRAGLALLAILPLLAGCVSPGNAVTDLEATPQTLTVPPSRLEAGTFYAFRHAGGTLALGVLAGGRAQVELFNGADQRLGQLSLSDALAGGAVRFQGMEPGDYVVRMLEVNGTLRIDSGGGAPALRPLATHVERHVLLQAPRGTTPSLPNGGLPGLPASPPAERSLDLRLLRAPTSLRLLAAGEHTSLEVELRSPSGPVLSATSGGFSTLRSLGPALVEVESEFHRENVRDGHLAGHVRAQDIEGVVLLEAASFSRAEPPALDAAPTRASPRFSYGHLPDVPARFQTGPRASQLLLHGNPTLDGNRTWVGLFDGHGRRLGTVPVEVGATLAVPVAASTTYVVALLRGNATLGADAAPSDFELHPLRVRAQTLPAEGAGRGGEYGQGAVDADGGGVFAVEPVLVSPGSGTLPFFDPFVNGCLEGTVRVAQGNETLGHWDGRALQRFASPDPGDAALRVRDGPLRVLDDGFGAAGCPRLAVQLQSFVL
ncbi:MAG TPA: hypothetical protein VHI93_00470 [Candidatus Thermoplasmatota archaeon]|nr:hypothetical protein [Candidatus Thermoplasmatota archaeon]